ncbi:fatty-acyl-CoA synthase [Desulfocicer vacuolatum DSM 3385]|uniref:Fatty-acyl-CoA synthase n=1 Tax=Desulfocicer vacuolatum DSM 3385 TaxID=1121400 RepID=A0A1W2CXA7_9BACT|nr:long-chain-fatty-acid--CoA ligase [Desulfocicer vacuolatum]SMC89626.1 fatty-acyl-CoA synthase [Desulfocicer vacuolatum DSM 3385]
MSYTIIDGFPSTSGDNYPLNTSSIIRGAAQTYPEVEIVSRQIDGTLFRYNYGQAYKRIQKLANALKRLGVKPGDRIGVMEWNTYRHFELYFAISGIGAVVLQMNLRLSPVDLSYVTNHSEARFIFVGDSLLPNIEGIADKLETVEGFVVITDQNLGDIKTNLPSLKSYEVLLEEEAAEFEWPMINENSAYSACYTTGTTGKPKGVYYSHRCIYVHTMMMTSSLRLGLTDVIMQTVPMFHGQGWGVWFCAPLVGAKLVFTGRYTMETTDILVDLMISEKVTFNNGAPAIFMPMLEYIRTLPEKPDFTGLRMISGATEPPLSMMRGYWNLGKAEVIHAYGATETTPIVLMNRFKPTIKGWTQEQEWANQSKQGLPVIGLDLKVIAPDGKQVPTDGETVGEILIRGPWITTSYYNDSRTPDCFDENGYWKSGDAATIDEHGYVKITDRFKDVIKSGGEWISSIDLENAIMSHDDVIEACVIGIAHPQWQERPLALVVLRDTAKETVSKEDILGIIGDHFAKWQLPDDVIFLDKLPKTGVGKFDKKLARSQYKDFYSE